jgi:hypothetical protein
MNFIRKVLVSVLIVALVSLLVMPARPAIAYPAAYFRSRQLRIPASLCLNAAKSAVQKAGLANVVNGGNYSGGTTPDTRAFIVCVTLPKAGPCPNIAKYRDGATAVFVAAGNKNDEALNLTSVLDTKFGDPVLIDCSP